MTVRNMTAPEIKRPREVGIVSEKGTVTTKESFYEEEQVFDRVKIQDPANTEAGTRTARQIDRKAREPAETCGFGRYPEQVLSLGAEKGSFAAIARVLGSTQTLRSEARLSLRCEANDASQLPTFIMSIVRVRCRPVILLLGSKTQP